MLRAIQANVNHKNMALGSRRNAVSRSDNATPIPAQRGGAAANQGEGSVMAAPPRVVSHQA
jgi:hypothetical protein